MTHDTVREAAKSLQEAIGLLAEEEASPKPFDKLKAALERASAALARSEPERHPANFAPPPRTTKEHLAAFVEALANITAALALILVVLVLALGKTSATPAPACCQLKCAPAQCNPPTKEDACND